MSYTVQGGVLVGLEDLTRSHCVLSTFSHSSRHFHRQIDEGLVCAHEHPFWTQLVYSPSTRRRLHMKYDQVRCTIVSLAVNDALDFQSRGDQLTELIDSLPEEDILDHLDHTGVIPEAFGHDSTEEKLYAKYCDALLARALALLGMETEVIQERGDSADVLARLEGYSVVGDAKAFRLSRTARNQKDFKVEALNRWRRGAEYAMLCSPLYQYPSARSQIYQQASTYNVTLLSYTHLGFLVRHKPPTESSLRDLWEVSGTVTPSQDAAAYWSCVDACVANIADTESHHWNQEVRALQERLPRLGEEQIAFWEAEKQRIQELPHDEAIEELIRVLKIESKMRTIRTNSGL